MSDEIYDLEEQIEELISEIQRGLNEAIKLKGVLKIEKYEYLKQRINRGNQLIKSLNVELREIPKGQAAIHEQNIKKYEEDLAKKSQDITWGISGSVANESINTNVEAMSAAEIMKAASNTQQQSLASTQRTAAVIEQTIQIGSDASSKLKDQGDQLQGISNDVDQLETNIRRAQKQLRIFVRRMATDKIIMALVLLVLLAIIGAIVVPIVKKKASKIPVPEVVIPLAQ